jgi:hypothetical protein
MYFHHKHIIIIITIIIISVNSFHLLPNIFLRKSIFKTACIIVLKQKYLVTLPGSYKHILGYAIWNKAVIVYIHNKSYAEKYF